MQSLCDTSSNSLGFKIILRGLIVFSSLICFVSVTVGESSIKVRYNEYPSFIQCQDGNFMVAYLGFPVNRSAIILVSMSDDGLNWSPSRKVTERFVEFDCAPSYLSLTQCNDGSYVLFFPSKNRKS